MMCLDPFRRATVLALAWCLVGLGFDPGPGAAPRPADPQAVNCQRTVCVPGQFASADTGGQSRSATNQASRAP